MLFAVQATFQSVSYHFLRGSHPLPDDSDNYKAYTPVQLNVTCTHTPTHNSALHNNIDISPMIRFTCKYQVRYLELLQIPKTSSICFDRYSICHLNYTIGK